MTSFIHGSVQSTKKSLDSKVNVSIKSSTTLYHAPMEYLDSYWTYQLVGTISNVWINQWIHSSSGISFCFHPMTQNLMWLHGNFFSLYLSCMPSNYYPNLIFINFLAWSHTCMFFLCVPYHLVGVSFNAISKAWILSSPRNCSLNSSMNSSISPKSSNLSGLVTLEPI